MLIKYKNYILHLTKWFSLVCVGLILVLLGACARPVSEVSTPAPLARQCAWSEIPGWDEDDTGAALFAFQRSCRALASKQEWSQVCAQARNIATQDAAARAFFEANFTPWLLHNADGSSEGIITGYYVPDIEARRTPDAEYIYPVFGPPRDMLEIDLTSIYPELAKYRLRGRIDGNRVVPYWDRAAIESDPSRIDADPLFWVRDPVELFFLHIQGSGRINLADGSRVMLNYANQNGHPYRSIGKLLLEHNEMTREQMSMQNIARWGQQHPERIVELLNENPRYVFFTPQLMESPTPPGAQGVPLVSGRSLAVDRSYVQLGTPIFIDTRWPREEKPLQRLMVAQDTGGAIKGRVRADFFWGVGDAAGWQAGAMKYPGRLWVLLPHGIEPGGMQVRDNAD